MISEQGPPFEAAELLQHPRTLDVDGEPPVYLRLTEPGDADMLYGYVMRNPYLGEYQHGKRKFTPEKAEGGTAGTLRDMEAGTRLHYKIMAGSDPDAPEEMVGAVLFYGKDEETGTARMGYELAESAQGKRIVSRAARRLLEYGRDRWSLRQVELEIEDGNTASRQLAERLGAQPTDQLEEATVDDEMVQARIWKLDL